MGGRFLGAVLLVMAAVGLPWLLLDGDRGKNPAAAAADVWATGALGPSWDQTGWSPGPVGWSPIGGMGDSWPASAGPHGGQPIPLEFFPVGLSEVFQFEVTPQWIGQRWQRAAANHQADGGTHYRIPLVTGTQPWDLHGSLTYEFDKHGTVRRIQFTGWTADSSLLIQTLTTQFRFQAQSTSWFAALASKSLGRLVGVAVFKRPTTVQGDRGTQQIAVWLEINDVRRRGEASPEAKEWWRQATSQSY